MLGLRRKAHSGDVVHPVPLPEPREEVQPEIAAQRLLDDLAVALPLAGGTDFHPAENVLVEGEGSAHL